MTGTRSWQTLLAAATSDNLTGAHGVAADAASVLVAYSHQASPASQDEFFSDLRRISRDLLRAQPAMASIANLLNVAGLAVDADFSLETLREAVETHITNARQAVAAVAQVAAALLEPHSVVMTISSSSTVAEALLGARNEGRRIQVICLESRPMLEGQRFAAMLAQAGLPVMLTVDAAAYECVSQSDVLFLGVDSLAFDGVVGKLGAAGLALAARKFGVPVYALADRSKIWPAGLGVPVIRERPAAEVWPDAPEGVRISNRYFDLTEWAGISGVVSEDGVRDGSQVREEGRAIHVHADLVALYRDIAEQPS